MPNARPQSYFYLLGLGWGLNGVMCGDLLSASRWLILPSHLRIIPGTANSRESDSQLALQTQGKACSVNLLSPTERFRSTSSSQPPCSFRVCSSPLPASAPRRLPQISVSLPSSSSSSGEWQGDSELPSTGHEALPRRALSGLVWPPAHCLREVFEFVALLSVHDLCKDPLFCSRGLLVHP